MGKKVKKGQMGPNTEFITRSSALKKLQITLKDFRRLCILKGIYPRVPTKGLKGNDKVYYDIKDISYIMHEPLLLKFREFKSFMKKIRKAAGRNQVSEARRKDELKPRITLNHLVKERYPRFIDALRDLDDALCMIHLFAALPSAGRVTTERTALCSRLVREWQYYVSKSRSLHKVFVSVKGVYFQAVILGEPVTWLVPHQFTQAIPKEVDLRVMLTFLEFYEVFMQFVLFKLYAMQNLQYPPAVDAKRDAAGCFLLAMTAAPISDDSAEPGAAVTSTTTIAQDSAASSAEVHTGKESTAEQLSSLPKLLKSLAARSDNDAVDSDEGDLEDDEDGADEELGQLAAPLSNAFTSLEDQPGTNHPATAAVTATTAVTGGVAVDDDVSDDGVGALERDTFQLSSDPRQRLFSGLVFFINREVPLEWLQLCTVSFGAKVGWDGPMSPFKVDDARITHQIVDRPQQATVVSFNNNNSNNNDKKKRNKKDESKVPSSSSSNMIASREYIQPQWVFDSVNAQMLLPVAYYRPGSSTLPPHLSPFVDDEKEGYMPRFREEIQKLRQQQQGQVDTVPQPTAQALSSAYSEKPGKSTVKVANDDDDNDGDDDGDSDEQGNNDSSDEEEEEEAEKAVKKQKQSNVTVSKKRTRQERILEDAAQGKRGPKGVVFKPSATEAISETEEAARMAQIMMSKKTKRLYGRMQHGIEKKKDAVRSLEEKRQRLEEPQPTAAAAAAGATKATTKAPKKRGK